MGDTPVDFVKAWIEQQPNLSFPPSWNGGWERWAQGQIAMFMNGRDEHQIWTEQNIYLNKSKDAVDLEFRRPPGVNGVRKFLELKCYSEVNDDTAHTFVTRVLEDYDKVQEPLKSGSTTEPDAKGSTLWVIGIAQEQFREEIATAGKNDKNNAKWSHFKSVEATCLGGFGGRGTFDIWYWSYVNNK